jgi:hypothetical protein
MLRLLATNQTRRTSKSRIIYGAAFVYSPRGLKHMATTIYDEGPHDQAWEVVEEDYSYLYVQRVGRDLDPQRIKTEASFALDRGGEPEREIGEYLAARLNALDRIQHSHAALEAAYAVLNSHVQSRIERVGALESALQRLADAVTSALDAPTEELSHREQRLALMAAETAAREALS